MTLITGRVAVGGVDYAPTATLDILGAPERVPSYGANGTHWPELVDTPWWSDPAPHVRNVPCTVAAITNAVNSFTRAEVLAGATVLVAPGTLTGAGTGTQPPLLADLGDPSWPSRVLIRPRDGWGTWRVDNARLLNLANVCLAGFSTTGIKLQASRRVALARFRCSGWLGVYGALNYPVVDDVELVEGVFPDRILDGGDRVDWYTNGSDIVRPRMAGMYLGARYRAVGDTAHADAAQYEHTKPTGGTVAGTVTGAVIEDSALFAGSSCCWIGKTGTEFRHCLLLTGAASQSRYPVPAGYDGPIHTLNGGDIDDLIVTDGTILSNGLDSGSPAITTTPTSGGRAFARVTGGILPAAPQAKYLPAQGAWTIEPGCSRRGLTECPIPTDAYLQSIWA